MEENRKKSKFWALGSNMMASMGVLAFVGYKSDKYFENKYYILTSIGLLLGLIWSMYEAMKVVNWLNRNEK